MANVYTTEAMIAAEVGAARLLSLLDRDGDGDADDGVLTRAIEKAGRFINTRLSQRFGRGVPFAQITDDPATPEGIQEIATDRVLYYLYRFTEPGGRDAEEYRIATEEGLAAIRSGEDDVPSAARPQAHEGKFIAVHDYEEPVFAGVDSNDADRLRGI